MFPNRLESPRWCCITYTLQRLKETDGHAIHNMLRCRDQLMGSEDPAVLEQQNENNG